jgi:hypothetical protein
VNMVFAIPVEFHALAEDVVELILGAGRAVFEKPENPGAHMKRKEIGTSRWDADWAHAGGWRCKHQHLAIVAIQEVGTCRR